MANLDQYGQPLRDPASAVLQRKYALAQALQKQGMDTSPVVGTGNTTMQAIARVLQAGVGTFLGQRAEGEAQAMSDAQKAEREKALATAAALYSGTAPAAPAAAPMTDRLGGAPPVEPPAAVPQVQQQPLGPPAGPTGPQNMYGRNAPLVAQRDAMLDAPPAVLASASADTALQRSGLPAAPVYREPDAVRGEGGAWAAGLPRATGAVPAMGGSAAAPPPQAAPASPNQDPSDMRRRAGILRGLSLSQGQSMAAALESQAAQIEARQFRQQDTAESRRFQSETLAETRRIQQETRAAADERARIDDARANEQLKLQREAAVRAAAADARAAGRDGVPANFERDPENPGATRPIRGGPADPAVIKAAAEARGEGRGGRVIPGHERNSMVEASTRIAETTALRDTFKPEYGGFRVGMAGDIANAIGRNTPGESPRSDWWSRYQSQKNQVRNQLFGASLTPGEQSEYEKADINPGMSVEAIRTNLARQAEIISTAQRRRVRSMAADGYNPRALFEASGIDPEDAPAPSAAPADAQAAAAAPRVIEYDAQGRRVSR